MKIDIRQNKQTLNSVPGVCIKYPWLLEKNDKKLKKKVNKMEEKT